MNLHQNKNETVEIFGARVGEILNGGSETARDAYNPEQLVGVNDLLKNTALTSFIKGLWNETARFYLNRQKDGKNLPDLESAINIASKIESELVDYSSPSASSKPFVAGVKIFRTDSKDHKCYQCNQIGHLRRDCSKGTRTHFSNREEIRCGYCRKTGHLEARCFKKQNQGGVRSRDEASNQSNLNSKRVPRGGATWTQPLIASTTNGVASTSQ